MTSTLILGPRREKAKATQKCLQCTILVSEIQKEARPPDVNLFFSFLKGEISIFNLKNQ